MTIGSPHRARPTHPDTARLARSVPGEWVCAGAYASLATARIAASQVNRGIRLPSYQPAGAFEAYAVSTLEGPVLWVRSTDGGPYPELPERMTVRVPVPGVEADTMTADSVEVLARCRTCGGPRGWDRVRPAYLGNDGELEVDRWDNPCGHLDTYADVLEEARALVGAPPAARGEAQPPGRPPGRPASTARGTGHHPAQLARAGQFRAAVELVLQVAAEERRTHARQAAALLRLHGHKEAAALVEAKIRAARGHLTAHQAARFLTAEGAARRSTGTTRQEANG